MGGLLGGIVLLGGYSSRMGRFKPAMEIGGLTLVERCVNLLFQAGLSPVVAVVGHNREEAEALAVRAGAIPVFNPHYPSGMFSSVKRGVEALMGEDLAGAFLLPVDIPLVRPCTVKALLDRFCSSHGGLDALIPSFKGLNGHPPVISGDCFGHILSHHGEGGLRALMSGWRVGELAVFDRHVLMDMDTPEDCQAIISRVSRMEVPDREECLELLRIHGTPMGAVEHSKVVAEVGLSIAMAMLRRGVEVRLDLLEAGCLLHDIAKGHKGHEAMGEEILCGLGFQLLGQLVGSHRDLPDRSRTLEAEILFLADKSVSGANVITLEDRMELMRSRFAQDPASLAAAEGRIGLAMDLRRRIEATLGVPLVKLLGLKPNGIHG